MDNSLKKAIAHVSCGVKNGTAFLVSKVHVLTAYHVVLKHVDGNQINVEFSLPNDSGKRTARLLNKREQLEDGLDIAILELDEPIEDIEPLQLAARNIEFGIPWKSFGFPTTKESTGQIFVGDIAQFVEQHISKYDLELNCEKPQITDPFFKTGGASGSPIIVGKEVIAVFSDKIPGGILGAVSIKAAKELLKEHRLGFKDIGDLEIESMGLNLEAILKIYSIRIQSYIDEKVTLPFNPVLDEELIRYKGLRNFFEYSTWKSKIKDHISLISRQYRNGSLDLEIGFVKKLQEAGDLEISYEEFRLLMEKTVASIQRIIPEDKRTNSLRPLLIDFYRLLNLRFNKVLLITGESGTGKTHLIKSILTFTKLEMGVTDLSLKIPLDVNNIIEIGIKNSAIRSINNFFGTQFKDISEVNFFINDIETKGIRLQVIFIIDDLHILLNTNAKFYKDLKEIITNYTRYDWISWILSINEFDQYLLMDNSNFLEKYSFSNSKSDYPDLMSLFINMSELNEEMEVSNAIFESYGMATIAAEEFPTNINNITMLLQNPLICHVYATTVEDAERDLNNLCFFNFIVRYSEVKKKEMIKISIRNLSVYETETGVDNDINQVVDFLMENKRLNYEEQQINPFFQGGRSDCFHELRSVHLIRKIFTEVVDPLGSYKKVNIQFVFKLYWAFKLLLQFRATGDWLEFSVWRNSIPELKEQLLIYGVLYLDMDFASNQAYLKKEIDSVVQSDSEKELLYFGAIKTSIECQSIIFQSIIEKEKISLNKQETFGLMYFLMNHNAKVLLKFKVLGNYLNKISEYGLGGYFASLCSREFGRMINLPKIKKSLSELLKSKDYMINRKIGKIVAENFIRVAYDSKEGKQPLSEEKLILNHLIPFLCENNLDEIIKSLDEKIGGGSGNSLIEYFLRYLFRFMIEHSHESNKFKLHEILLSNNLYFLEQGIEKYEARDNYKFISHILRTSCAIAYGSYYKHVSHTKKEIFQKQYMNCISNLLQSESQRPKILAFHFILNTLFDQNDPNSILDPEFIPFLERIYADRELIEFNSKRKAFFEKNLKAYS